MKISNLPVWLLAASLCSPSSSIVAAIAASSSRLRGGGESTSSVVNINGRKLSPPHSTECLIHAVALLEIEPGSMDNDLEFGMFIWSFNLYYISTYSSSHLILPLLTLVDIYLHKL